MARLHINIFIVSMLFVILSHAWWDGDWDYRMAINVTSDSAGSGISTMVTLNNSNFNYAKANSNLTDLRITYYNETAGTETEVGIWIESVNTSGNSYIWFNATEVDTGNTTYYLYYGNSNASSVSDGNEVFEFFDDFEGSSLNTSKWTCTNTCSVSGGKVTVSHNSGQSKIVSKDTFGEGYKFETKANFGTGASTSWPAYFGVENGSSVDYYVWNTPVSGGTRYIQGVNYVSATASTSTFSYDSSDHIYSIYRNNTATKYYYDKEYKDQVTTQLFSSLAYIYFVSNENGVDVQSDWVYAYQYKNLTLTFGDEESNPNAYISSTVINPDDAYELTTSTFQINLNYSDTINDTSATLYYDGTAYTNTSYSYDEHDGRKYANYTFEVSHPFIEVNDTSYTYSYNITYINSSGSYDYSDGPYTQNIYYAYWIKNVTADDYVVLEGQNVVLTTEIGNVSSLANIDVKITFNNTNYSTTNNHPNYTASVTIPDVDTSTDFGIIGWLNVSYDGQYIVRELYGNNLTAFLINVSYGGDDLVFNLYDEIDLSEQIGDFEGTLTVCSSPSHTICNDFNFSASNTHNLSLGFYPENSTYYVDSFLFYKTNYSSWRQYFLRNASITHNNVSLYVLNSSEEANLQLELKDQNLQPVSEAYVLFKRYYPGENIYRTVAMLKTDTNGEGNTYIEPNDIYYRITVNQNYQDTKEFEAQKIYCTSYYCALTLSIEDTIEGYYSTYEGYISSNCTYINSTNTLACSYSDSSGLMKTMTLTVWKEEITGRTTECEQSTTSSAATLLCTLTNPQNNVYTYKLESKYNPTVINQYGTIDLASDNEFGNLGLFISWGVILTLGLIGMFNPAVGIVLIVTAIPLLALTKLISIGISSIVALIILSAVLIYRLRV